MATTITNTKNGITTATIIITFICFIMLISWLLLNINNKINGLSDIFSVGLGPNGNLTIFNMTYFVIALILSLIFYVVPTPQRATYFYIYISIFGVLFVGFILALFLMKTSNKLLHPFTLTNIFCIIIFIATLWLYNFNGLFVGYEVNVVTGLLVLFLIIAYIGLLIYYVRTRIPGGANSIFNQLNYVQYFINTTNVGYLILYIVLIGILLAFVPSKYINYYFKNNLTAFITTTLIIFLYVMFFNKSFMLIPNFFLTYKIVVFICIISLLILLYINNPGDIFNSSGSFGALTIGLLLSLFVFFMIYLLMPNTEQLRGYKSFAILLSIISSLIFIGYLIYNIYNYAYKYGYAVFILMLILFIFLLIGVTYFILIMKGYNNKLFAFLLNTVLYIPCLFSSLYLVSLSRIYNTTLNVNGAPFKMSGVFDYLKIMGQSTADNITNTQLGYWIMLIVGFLLLMFIIYLPYIKNSLYLGMGNYKQLLKGAVSLSNEQTISNYTELYSISSVDTSLNYDYNYGLNFWVYLAAYGENMNYNYNTFAPILNYGNKPIIEYNASKNTLRIRMQNNNKLETVYEGGNIPLQKWLNIVVNYSGSVIDVYIDAKLVKSIGGVISYMKMDDLTVGSVNGLFGDIANIIYGYAPFTLSNIYYLKTLYEPPTPTIFA